MNPAAARPPILAVSGLSFGFGGVAALSEVDLEVHPGECVGLIGPNGAGKSTLLNCVSRVNHEQAGSIQVDGVDCAGRLPADMIALGVKRTFQNIETFSEMKVREVLQVGAHSLASASMFAAVLGLRRVRRESAQVAAEVDRTAAALGLSQLLDIQISALPYGLQKKVDLARALVGGARLLLLDEPAAGLSEWEWNEMLKVLLELRGSGEMGILVIEHQLGFVRQLADRLYALDAGKIVAQGDPATVLDDRRVVEAYIGTATAP
jgi:branched-chain amino acid transport system ATP-binding protein